MSKQSDKLVSDVARVAMEELEKSKARIADLVLETQSQKDVIDMLAQSKAEIEVDRLCWVRGLMPGCKTIPALDERITDEIERLRREGL